MHFLKTRVVLGLSLMVGLAAPVSASDVDADLVQVTAGSNSLVAFLSLDAQQRAHISYSQDSWQNSWTYSLGYAVVDTELLAVESQDDELISFNHCGEAQILSAPGGGQVLFHHRWVAPREEYFFVGIDSQGQVASDLQITDSGGCTNSDSSAGAIALGDGSFGLIYSSCRGTGQNDSSRNNLYYTKRDADGAALIADLTLETSTFVEQGAVAASVDGSGRIHFIYLDWSTGGHEIYYQRIDADGISQIGRTLVPTDVGSVSQSWIASGSSGLLELAFSASANDSTDIYRMTLSEDGAVVSPPTRITETGSAVRPVIATDTESAVHLLWTETLGDSLGVHYAKFDPDGASLIPAGPLTSASAWCRSLVVDASGTAHACWTTGNGTAPGNIYYARIRPSTASSEHASNGVAPFQLRIAPNPANSRSRVSFFLERPTHVDMTVHDVAGRRVRTLASGELAQGAHSYSLSGSGDLGESVGAGTYFVRLAVAGLRPVETKVTLLPR